MSKYNMVGTDYSIEPFVPEKHFHFNQEKYHNWSLDNEVTRYNSHGLFRKTKKDIDSWLSSIENGDILCWGIFYKKEWIGVISLQSINRTYQSAEIALYIGERKHWGKGVASFAVSSVVSHGFERLNFNRIWSGTAAHNVGMNKVFARTGFKSEGVFREGMYVCGKYENINLYSILKSDYEKIGFDERDNQ